MARTRQAKASDAICSDHPARRGARVKRERVWVRIARADDIPLREGRAVEVRGREIAIFNLGNRFLSVANRCPHRSGPLADGMVSGASVVCPLHAWTFSLETGEGQAAPSLGSCVQTFSTRVEDGIVAVELPLDREEGEGIPASRPQGESGRAAVNIGDA
ncbi:MAG: nitrite reductase small subunit NirD [Acidobacteria bacterium]|nr:nitrite reductase small subunit NirD [Acidobacteriota bacterium]